MRKKRKLIIGIVLGIAILCIGLFLFGKSKLKKTVESNNIQDQTYTVALGNIEAKIDITGEVQPQTVVSIKSRVSGRIVKFYAAENDYVKSGQIIADIEPDYNQANTLFNTKASLKRAELSLEKARKDVSDKRILLENKYLSQADFDSAADVLKNAEIEYAQASSQYEMIRDLDVPGKVTHVYATASGTVIERNVNEGEMVTSSITGFGEGTVIMKIAELTHMIVKSNINEVDIAKFRLGQHAKIKLDALPYEEYSGRIVKIAPMAITENNAKVFPVEISIGATGTGVKPGMTAAVSIEGESKENVVIIPIGAVFADEKGQDIVYLMPKEQKTPAVKDKKGKPIAAVGSPTPVQLGSNDLQMVEIVAGLKTGDVISLTEPNSNMGIRMGFN